MKKIGIISEFNMRTVNYGNNLQAFALNWFINNKLEKYIAESIYFKDYMDSYVMKQTMKEKHQNYHKWLCKIGRIKYKLTDIRFTVIRKRWEAFVKFARKNIKMPEEPMTFSRLMESEYDFLIVGSDVVWGQSPKKVNRIKFLDFTNKRCAKKIAYAASFGERGIPKENQNAIAEMLKDFKAISLRESSAVEMLCSIGVENTEHMADPTFLLTKQEWETISIFPKDLKYRKKRIKNIEERYLFVYLLGAKRKQRKIIEQYAKNNKLTIISIPYASGYWNAMDRRFGDVWAWNCSPEEWIWFIAHAELVVTDSFHGMIFATIFQKKFIVLERQDIRTLNDRMYDYLNHIEQKDKIVANFDKENIWEKEWDYMEINKKIEIFREKGICFLQKALSCN